MNVIIIPAYLREARDITMLRKLTLLAGNDLGIDHIIIVDDCSPLKYDLHPCLKIRGEQIRLHNNRGPAHARNVGMERALKLGATNLFFTDHDCELMPGWGKAFEYFLEKENYPVAGGITRSSGNTLLDLYHEMNGTLNGRLLPNGELLYTPSCNLAMQACVAMNFRFDESFPDAAGEDVDFCFRVRRKYRIGLCKNAIIDHNWGYKSTIGGIPQFIRMLKKYKAAHSLLRSKHGSMNWKSESIPSRKS